MSELMIIWSVDISINVICLMMHLLGIYSILYCRRKTTQLLILLNLSSAEAIASVYSVVNDVHRLSEYNNSTFNDSKMIRTVFTNELPPFYHEISFVIYYMTGFEILLIYLLLIFDRLLSITIPIKCKVFITRRRSRFIIASSWGLSTILGLLYGILPTVQQHLVYLFSFGAFVYIVAAILTYTIVVYKIKNKMHRVTLNTHAATQPRVQFKKQYRIPAFIVITYFILYSVPLIIQRFYVRSVQILTKSTLILHECLSILVNFGMISDVVIYVFLTPFLRAVIRKLFTNCRSSFSNLRTKRKSKVSTQLTLQSTGIVQIQNQMCNTPV